MITKLVAKYYTLISSEVNICSRKDYWIFVFIYNCAHILILFISTILASYEFPNIFQLPLFFCSIALGILLIILSIKRLHDANLSGFWILFPFINIVLLFSPSIIVRNKYTTKEVSQEDEEENDKLEAFIKLLEKEK